MEEDERKKDEEKLSTAGSSGNWPSVYSPVSPDQSAIALLNCIISILTKLGKYEDVIRKRRERAMDASGKVNDMIT